MKHLLLALVSCGLIPAFPLDAEEPANPVAGQIRKLIPAAAAMKQEDFERIAFSPTAPKASDVKEQSLTWMILALKPTEATPEQQQEFRYLGEAVPKPSEFAGEMYRVLFRVMDKAVLNGPVTAIHANRIKDLTVEVKDRQASGTVMFEVPKLYAGQVNYLARQDDQNQWWIAEWHMPARDVHLVRESPAGLWQKQPAVP